jgi:hypothetical protein
MPHFGSQLFSFGRLWARPDIAESNFLDRVQLRHRMLTQEVGETGSSPDSNHGRDTGGSRALVHFEGALDARRIRRDVAVMGSAPNRRPQGWNEDTFVWAARVDENVAVAEQRREPIFVFGFDRGRRGAHFIGHCLRACEISGGDNHARNSRQPRQPPRRLRADPTCSAKKENTHSTDDPTAMPLRQPAGDGGDKDVVVRCDAPARSCLPTAIPFSALAFAGALA